MRILSHYTSKVGLDGIARSGCLWAGEFLRMNDKSEFTYATNAIFKTAMESVIDSASANTFRPGSKEEIYPQFANMYLDGIKKLIDDHGGFGGLYITSFARGRDKSEDKDGILTLWDRYTGNLGFCIQFSEQEIRRVVSVEQHSYNYALIEVAEIIYGLDENDSEFIWISHQIKLRLCKFLFDNTGIMHVTYNSSEIVPDSAFLLRFLRFAGTHKHPAFSDEREVRILAYPERGLVSEVLSGIKFPKKIQRIGSHPDGKRYITIGEGIVPAISPVRIVAGPKVNLDQQAIRSAFPLCQHISKTTIPIQ